MQQELSKIFLSVYIQVIITLALTNGGLRRRSSRMKEPSFFFAISISQLYIVLCTRPQYIYQISKLFVPKKPVETSLWGVLAEQYCTVYSISAPDQTSQEGNECTTSKEKLRAYCPNIYTVTRLQILSSVANAASLNYVQLLCLPL